MKERIQIAGIPFDRITLNGVLAAVQAYIKGNHQAQITTPNPEMVLEARRNENFRAVLQKAQLSIPDGIGILWASYYLSLPGRGIFQLITSLLAILFAPQKIQSQLPERVTGTDLFESVIRESQQEKWRVFLLGARPGIAKTAIDRLLKKYPKAIFAGSHAGSPSREEEESIRRLINHARPDVLFVAYGNPYQELWIARNLSHLPSVRVAVGVGGAFDFAAGAVRRAPSWIRKIGMEWLWRLLREPRRIRRIWNATIVFIRLIHHLKKLEKIRKN